MGHHPQKGERKIIMLYSQGAEQAAVLQFSLGQWGATEERNSNPVGRSEPPLPSMYTYLLSLYSVFHLRPFTRNAHAHTRYFIVLLYPFTIFYSRYN